MGGGAEPNLDPSERRGETRAGEALLGASIPPRGSWVSPLAKSRFFPMETETLEPGLLKDAGFAANRPGWAANRLLLALPGVSLLLCLLLSPGLCVLVEFQSSCLVSTFPSSITDFSPWGK